MSLFMGNAASAQLNPLGATYFQNQYLANPAMAGFNQGLDADLAYRKQWSTIPGAPETQAVTVSYGSSKRAGLGLSVFSDGAGLQKNTRVMGTYAYHLPVSADNKISFGLSLGVMNERLMNEEISSVSGQPDRSVSKYAQREAFVDGDFGLAFTSKRLTLQGAIPNMKSFFKRDQRQGGVVDQDLFMTAASYKFFFPSALDGMGLEPKIVYRKVMGYKSIADIGANATLANSAVNVMAMYHTSRSTTLGMGVKYKSLMQINGIFTSGTAALRNYVNGNFELNLKVNVSELIKGDKRD